MKKVLAIARWEFLEKVKTKAFIISIILTPLILIGFALAPALFSQQEADSTKAIGILDEPGIYFQPLKDKLQKYKIEEDVPSYVLLNLNDRVQDFAESKRFADASLLKNKIDGYILIQSPNRNSDSIKIEYRSSSAGNLRDIRRFEEELNNIRLELKLKEENINPELLKIISSRIEINNITVDESGAESKSDFLTVFLTSFILIMLLVMIILSSGGMLIRSLVEEKSSRLIEILVSSCTPDQLLLGKILGLSSLGLLQVVIWSLAGLFLTSSAIVSPDTFKNLLPMLLYFLLGFLFYTSIFVGIGSVVSTEQEAQQVTQYLSLLLFLPVVLAVPVIENPDSIITSVFSYVPFTTATIMILRFNIAPIPIHEIVVTITILIVSTYLTIQVTAKIFRIGILSYGKRPSLKEIVRWVRE